MELYTLGKQGSPVLLLIAARNMDPYALPDALKSAADRFELVSAAFSQNEDSYAFTSLLEEYLVHEHAGRVRGAYGLREGGNVLLSLLAGGRVFARTAVADSAAILPEGEPDYHAGQLHFWYNKADRRAAHTCEVLRKQAPGLHTVRMLKLKRSRDWYSVNPATFEKRLMKLMGNSALLRLDTPSDMPPDSLWKQVGKLPPLQAVRRLKERKRTERSDSSRRMVVEGRVGPLKLWSHVTTVEPGKDSASVYTEQAEVEAGLLTPAAKAAAGFYLKALRRARLGSMKIDGKIQRSARKDKS